MTTPHGYKDETASARPDHATGQKVVAALRPGHATDLAAAPAASFLSTPKESA